MVYAQARHSDMLFVLWQMSKLDTDASSTGAGASRKLPSKAPAPSVFDSDKIPPWMSDWVEPKKVDKNAQRGKNDQRDKGSVKDLSDFVEPPEGKERDASPAKRTTLKHLTSAVRMVVSPASCKATEYITYRDGMGSSSEKLMVSDNIEGKGLVGSSRRTLHGLVRKRTFADGELQGKEICIRAVAEAGLKDDTREAESQAVVDRPGANKAARLDRQYLQTWYKERPWHDEAVCPHVQMSDWCKKIDSCISIAIHLRDRTQEGCDRVEADFTGVESVLEHGLRDAMQQDDRAGWRVRAVMAHCMKIALGAEMAGERVAGRMRGWADAVQRVLDRVKE